MVFLTTIFLPFKLFHIEQKTTIKLFVLNKQWFVCFLYSWHNLCNTYCVLIKEPIRRVAMKTLITLAFTSMIALPAFANTETDNVKDVTDAYITQHNHDVQQSMQTKVKKDILLAIRNFTIPKQEQLQTLVAQNRLKVEEVTEQADIE